MLKQESILYPDRTKAQKEAYLKDYNQQPKTLQEAQATIADLLTVVRELQLREDVAIQGRVAANLGVPRTENPYHDKDDRGLSLELIWEDSYNQEREHFVVKDRLARMRDLMIAAVTLKNTICSSENLTKQQSRAVNLFNLSMARLKEQLSI